MTVTFDSHVGALDGAAVSGTHGSFVAQDGCKLYAHRWLSRNAEHAGAAVLVVMHGYGEHIERYDEFAHVLVAAGHPVYGFDARGHGRSPGQRGYIRFHNQFVDDMQRFLIEIRARHPSRPLVLLGHSHQTRQTIDRDLTSQVLFHVFANAPALGGGEPECAGVRNGSHLCQIEQ